MFERLKDCADRINDQLGRHKASARSRSVDRHRALAPCAPGNPGNLQVRRAMGGGASSGAARLGTVSYCDQGTLLSRAALRRARAERQCRRAAIRFKASRQLEARNALASPAAVPGTARHPVGGRCGTWAFVAGRYADARRQAEVSFAFFPVLWR